MRRQILSVTLPVCLAIVVAGTWLARAGDISPPPGPVQQTMKTLTEVEPRIAVNATNTPGDATSLFKITQPGSYYLTGNITGEAGKDGIAINASGVTLDLNGFALIGVPGSLYGIHIPGDDTSSLSGARVRNGTVADWDQRGVSINVHGGSVVDMTSYGNGTAGFMLGASVTAERCTARLNGGRGFAVGSHCTVRDCHARENDGDGFSSLNTYVVIGCTSLLNGGHGIFIGKAGVVSQCQSAQNTGDGIRVGEGCTVESCASWGNTGVGINASDSLVRGNTAVGNTGGNISANVCTVVDNHAP